MPNGIAQRMMVLSTEMARSRVIGSLSCFGSLPIVVLSIIVARSSGVVLFTVLARWCLDV